MAAISALATFFITFGRNFLTWFYNVIVDFVNTAISTFSAFVITVVSLFPTVPLPTSAPATPTGRIFDVLLQTLNWLFPMTYLVAMVAFIVAGILAYWLIAPVARWAKLLT